MPLRPSSTVLGKRCLSEIYPVAPRTVSFQFLYRARPFTTNHYQYQQLDETSSSKRPSTEEGASQKAAGNPAKQSPSERSNSQQLNQWDTDPDLSISKFSELPSKDFGVNQHIIINEEFKEALRQILWKFRAPIRYAFAYGSGVFPQSASSSKGATLHPNPPDAISKVQGGNQKMIDFIFGVSYTQHWHSLNLQEHRDHYSAYGSLGSYAVTRLQNSFGAGVYFNPYVTVNGTLIKYGVVNLDTLCKDLSEWNTLYIAGRLQKPVKILRDNPSVRLANQVNLISAVRVALLLLPENFTEKDLYATIAGISYMGDPRMSVGGDDPKKVNNIVTYQFHNFRRLYGPLIDNLPNLSFNDPACSKPEWFDDPSINANITQNMDPVTRGHMVRRLPAAFRQRLYFEYQSKFSIPRGEFNRMLEQTKDEDPERIRRREGGPFERRIAEDTEGGGLRKEVEEVISKTIWWPAFSQSLKSVITAGVGRSWRYVREKRQKAKAGLVAPVEKHVPEGEKARQKEKEEAGEQKQEDVTEQEQKKNQ